MPTFASLDAPSWTELLDRMRDDVRRCGSLEEAAQHVARDLYERFAETTALARVYALVKRGDLPADVGAFVDDLAKMPVDASTSVLALLGTHGEKEEWCDRRRSRAHKGIPLLSGAFVDAIPMLARLLRELGIDLSWLDAAPEVATRRLLGGFNGTFYVADARSARDAQGRRIIPAADFVVEQDVKTVFGNGGFYPDGTLIVCIVFTREELQRPQVERLASLISMLKGETFGLSRARKIFTS